MNDNINFKPYLQKENFIEKKSFSSKNDSQEYKYISHSSKSKIKNNCRTIDKKENSLLKKYEINKKN